jgi:hypothetical protein
MDEANQPQRDSNAGITNANAQIIADLPVIPVHEVERLTETHMETEGVTKVTRAIPGTVFLKDGKRTDETESAIALASAQLDTTQNEAPHWHLNSPRPTC